MALRKLRRNPPALESTTYSPSPGLTDNSGGAGALSAPATSAGSSLGSNQSKMPRRCSLIAKTTQAPLRRMNPAVPCCAAPHSRPTFPPGHRHPIRQRQDEGPPPRGWDDACVEHVIRS